MCFTGIHVKPPWSQEDSQDLLLGDIQNGECLVWYRGKYKYAKILSVKTGILVWLGPVLLWFWWQLWGWFLCWLQCTEVFKMMHKAIIWWRNQMGLQFILMEFVKSKCYATSNNLIIFRPKLVLVLWFFSDCVNTSKVICQKLFNHKQSANRLLQPFLLAYIERHIFTCFSPKK